MSAPVFSLPQLKVACSTCRLRELCLPFGLSLEDVKKLDGLVATHRRVRRGESLFRAGDPFETLYAVRLGMLKSMVVSSEGREQVTGFHMAGELIGLDGIASDQHSCSMVSLEDSEVCVIPYGRLEDVVAAVPALRSQFHKVMSREIVREQAVMLLLGSMKAEERMAAFLLDLSRGFEARGFSRTEFVLRMTRAEIGSFLGLKLETVSRLLSRFAHYGLIEVSLKHVRIISTEGLLSIVSDVPVDRCVSVATG